MATNFREYIANSLITRIESIYKEPTLNWVQSNTVFSDKPFGNDELISADDIHSCCDSEFGKRDKNGELTQYAQKVVDKLREVFGGKLVSDDWDRDTWKTCDYMKFNGGPFSTMVSDTNVEIQVFTTIFNGGRLEVIIATDSVAGDNDFRGVAVLFGKVHGENAIDKNMPLVVCNNNSNPYVLTSKFSWCYSHSAEDLEITEESSLDEIINITSKYVIDILKYGACDDDVDDDE